MLSQLKSKGCLLMLFAILSGSSFAQLNASFKATPENGCAPLIVRFSDSSTGNPTQWRWDLGNGTTSFLQNPSATYFTPGSYTIKLVIKSGTQTDSITKVDYIEVGSKPTIEFNSSTTTGCYPLPVQFSDLSIANNGTLNSWQWDFGDGATSTLQNPMHEYTGSGNYNVTLQVKNSIGCVASIVKPAYIKISSGVLASFTNTVPNNCSAPASVNFTNTSTGTGTLSHYWDFGDGNSSTLQNPTHIYNNIGSFTVKLIVNNSNGCTDTLVKTNGISIGTVRANFRFTDSVCVGQNVLFTNTSTPSPATVKWYFGDGDSSTTLSPTKIYLSGNFSNTFTVKMIADFGACKDSINKQIKVFKKPAVAFGANDTLNCSTPFTVLFTNTSNGGANYEWSFGDGTISTLRTPSHTYTSFGSFTVKLKVKSVTGCIDSLVKTNYILIKKPVINFINLPDSGCAPLTKNFSATVASVSGVNTYLWDFGDGSTSTLPTPTHLFNNVGIYPIKLLITSNEGCTDSAIIAKGILVGNKPIINFDVTPRNTCAKNTINFSSSTPNATGYLWDFGDNTTSTLQNPSHIYQDTGFFDITLRVWHNGCMDSIIAPKHVYINPPIAKFDVKLNCLTSLQRSFEDKSIGADTWSWSFGDGTASTLQNPNHTYAISGNYEVSLTVKNTNSGCEFTTTQQIKVVNVVANFAAIDTNICKGYSVLFTTGLIASEISSFKWQFSTGGNFINSTANSISHTFNANGLYTVTLITTDVNGCLDTAIKNNYIKVTSPTAKFTSIAGSCINSLIVFRDSSTADSTANIVSWKWNYGDGNVDSLTAAPFQHAYNAAGSYFTTLTVTDAKGCIDSVKQTTPIKITKPLAYFANIDTITCPLRTINFGNASFGIGLTYNWDFGDLNTSTIFRPSHTYAADGSYTVRLIATDVNGCKDTMTRPSYIKIITPNADFYMSDSVVYCPPLLVQFTNTSSNALTTLWDFGDSSTSTIKSPSHFYLEAGTYIVRLTVTGPGGCSSYKEKTIVISGPKGTFSYNAQTGCNPLTINFTGTSQSPASFVFDFNDGSLETSPNPAVSHTFTYPGNYVPRMILVDANGCQVPILGLDTIVVKGVAAKFDFSKLPICDSGIVNFIDSSYSNDVITGYKWAFGDGGISNIQNPSHTFTNTGNYLPSLIISTLAGCSDTAVATIPIKIVSSPKIAMLATGNGCTPLQVAFAGQIAVPDTSAFNWKWDFANGNTSTVTHPPVQPYVNGGIYSVTLKATNSTGCTTTLTKNIEAFQTPTVVATNDTLLCKGSSITLSGTGALYYSWSPAIGLSCTNCASPVTTTANNIKYKVTGTTIKGCKASDSVFITVKSKFNLSVSGVATMCNGETRKIKATGADKYLWSPPNGLKNVTDSIHDASPTTTTNYQVIASDNVGCFKDTGYVKLTVYPIPTVEAGIDKKINVGQSIDLIPILSNDVTEVIWMPTDGLTRNTYPSVTVRPNETTDYTVEAKNPGGCLARDKVTVFVVCNGGNVFIPNTFSPNNDGSNDVFYPRGTGLFKIKSFNIFNRWGQKMFEKNSFEANDPAFGWDGTFKGVQLPPDVFVYSIEIICANNTVLLYRGNVALVR